MLIIVWMLPVIFHYTWGFKYHQLEQLLWAAMGLQEAPLCTLVCSCRWSPWGKCLGGVIQRQDKLDAQASAWAFQVQMCLGDRSVPSGSIRYLLVFLCSYPFFSYTCLTVFPPLSVSPFFFLPSSNLAHLRTTVFPPLPPLWFEKPREPFFFFNLFETLRFLCASLNSSTTLTLAVKNWSKLNRFKDLKSYFTWRLRFGVGNGVLYFRTLWTRTNKMVHQNGCVLCFLDHWLSSAESSASPTHSC